MKLDIEAFRAKRIRQQEMAAERANALPPALDGIPAELDFLILAAVEAAVQAELARWGVNASRRKRPGRIERIRDAIYKDIVEGFYPSKDVAELYAMKATRDGVPSIWFVKPDAVCPFKVGRFPQVGDDVSREFNGDAYPCGQIVSVSPTGSVIRTSNEIRFQRVSAMGWREGGKGGAFSLVQGVLDKRNPEI